VVIIKIIIIIITSKIRPQKQFMLNPAGILISLTEVVQDKDVVLLIFVFGVEKETMV